MVINKVMVNSGTVGKNNDHLLKVVMIDFNGYRNCCSVLTISTFIEGNNNSVIIIPIVPAIKVILQVIL